MKFIGSILLLSTLLFLNNGVHAQDADIMDRTICEGSQEILLQEQVDRSPVPPGGFHNFRERINNLVEYPPSAAENGIAGRVTLAFVVCSTGALNNIEVVHSKSDDCDKEAKRVLIAAGLWTPAQKNDENVSSKVRYSVNFRNKD